MSSASPRHQPSPPSLARRVAVLGALVCVTAACADDGSPSADTAASVDTATTADTPATTPTADTPIDPPGETVTETTASSEVEHGTVDLGAFVTADELPDHGSAAFVLLDRVFHFISAPGAEDTSISHISATTAWGWSRDLPVDDPAATSSSWELDLETGEFTAIEMPGVTWSVLRGGVGAGPLVGKLAGDSDTPADDSDDATYGFVIDAGSDEVHRVARDGYSDIGFTDANADGLIIGFNDFGTLGFVYADGSFTDLLHPDAYRLFPFSINDEGVIVGFWGSDEDTWYTNGINPAFVASPADGGYEIERYELPGFTGVGLTAIDNAGRIAGMAWESADATPLVVVADGATSLPQTFEAPAGTSPFVTGMAESGAVFGQAFLFPVEPATDDGAEAAATDTPISDAVRGLSGPSHSGPFASALHGYIHELESAAEAADAAVASDEGVVAAVAEVAALLEAIRGELDTVDDAAADERTEVDALLDAVEAAAADAATALDS